MRFLLISILLPFLAFAETKDLSSCHFLPPVRACMESPSLLDQSDVYAQISLLYWEASERGLDYGLKNTQPQFQSQMRVLQPIFNWEPALRLLAGTHLPQGWDLDLTYSFFLHSIQSNAKHNFDPSSPSTFGEGILAVWTAPKAFLSENIYARWQYASSKWKLHAQFFDLLLRCDLRNSPALLFQPAFGLKMALLQQRYTVAYAPGNIVTTSTGLVETLLRSTVNMKNRSFNLGPEMAMATRWCITNRWNLFGSLSGALLASQFNVGRNEFDVSQTASTIIGSYRFNDTYWTYRPQAALSLGVQWGDCVCRPSKVIHYAFALSYEAQVWWKQNMFLRHIDASTAQSPNLAPVRGDLIFQGLTFDFLIDF